MTPFRLARVYLWMVMTGETQESKSSWFSTSPVILMARNKKRYDPLGTWVVLENVPLNANVVLPFPPEACVFRVTYMAS